MLMGVPGQVLDRVVSVQPGARALGEAPALRAHLVCMCLRTPFLSLCIDILLIQKLPERAKF